MPSNPFSSLFCEVNSLVSYLDKSLMVLENSKQFLSQLDNLNSGLKSENGFNKISLLTKFLLDNKVAKISEQIKQIVTKNIKPGIETILTFVSEIITQTNQLYSLFDSSANKSLSEFSSENLAQNQVQNNKIISLLKENFGLQAHFSGFDKSTFSQFSNNMELIQTDKVRSKPINFQQEEEKALAKKIIFLRELMTTSNFKEEKNQLLALYMKLFNLNSYRCIYQKIIYPIINSINFQKVQEAKQISESNTHKLIKTNLIQFKIEAQGFVSNQSVKLPSFKEKVSEIVGRTKNIDHTQKKQNLSSTKQFHITLTTFEDNFIAFYENLEQSEEERFFEFGLIDATSCQKFLNQNNFLNCVGYENSKIETQNTQKRLDFLIQEKEIGSSEKFSVKILNIDNKFFIQSEKQAKLIKLDPKWEYFSIRVIQSEERPFPSIELYGLIKSVNDNQSSVDIFQEQLILSYPMSPSMAKQILKPFFIFKNFQCKITIKPSSPSP